MIFSIKIAAGIFRFLEAFLSTLGRATFVFWLLDSGEVERGKWRSGSGVGCGGFLISFQRFLVFCGLF